MDPPGARVRILMTVKPNKLRQRNGPLSVHIYETEFFLSTITKALRPGQTINVGRPNMLGEPTFYRLATVFDDHSTCWMMLEHV